MPAKLTKQDGFTMTMCNEKPRQSTALRDMDGDLISVRGAIKMRWIEHFREVFNREEPENPITDDEECEFGDRIEEIVVTEQTLKSKKQ